MKKEKKESWIIVTNKKTYLLLAAAVCCLLFLIGDAVYTFALGKREVIPFVGDCFSCIMIAVVLIYFFVRFNTYSHLFNPDHPKPDYNRGKK